MILMFLEKIQCKYIIMRKNNFHSALGLTVVSGNIVNIGPDVIFVSDLSANFYEDNDGMSTHFFPSKYQSIKYLDFFFHMTKN